LRKKRISSKDYRYLLAFAAVTTLFTSCVAYAMLNPPRSEGFYAIWILGSNGLAEHYYPDDNPDLKLGEELNWTIGVQNHMGSPQFVLMRVRLLNSTLLSSAELAEKPSDVQPLLEFTRILLANETWSIPFEWTILDLVESESGLLITRISVNQVIFSGELATAISGINYRFVFELWFYDQTTGEVTFSHRIDDLEYSFWVQIWFNATQTTQ